MIGDLVIVGARGHGKEIASLVEAINGVCPTWNLLGFVDDDPVDEARASLGYPILGGLGWLEDHLGMSVAIAVGNPRSRAAVVARLAACDLIYPSLVHPSAILHEPTVEIGEGVLVFAGTTVMVEAVLRDHVHVNLHCTISHNAQIGAYSIVNPGANLSGDVILEPGVYIGTGACMIQGLTIGSGSIIGAGATVVDSIPANVVAVGTPARPIRDLEPFSAP